jgi:curved DNA-binding protein
LRKANAGVGDVAMSDARPFVDYYAILRVHPECDHRTLEIAYRNLAKIYHPDHPETADIDMFNAVIEAYRALKDQGKRLAYDALYSSNTGFVFAADDDILAEERTALSDADVHAEVLLYRAWASMNCSACWAAPPKPLISTPGI